MLHICGAMGRPAWAMISYPADWRWRLEGDVSHWYPSVSLFRQKRWRDNWDEPFAVVREKLTAILGKKDIPPTGLP
jgi:hypothetical protein